MNPAPMKPGAPSERTTAPALPPSAVGSANGLSMPAKGDAVKIQHASDLAHELTPEGRTFKNRRINPHE